MFARHLHEIDWTATTAVVALILSMINVYFVHFRVKFANVLLLNHNDEQETIPRQYDRLPASVKHQFPEYDCRYPLYATVRLVFANIGDRPGYAKLKSVKLVQSWPETDDPLDAPEYYNYTYVLIPPQSIIDHIIMLRNLPLHCDHYTVKVHVSLDIGGPRGRFIASINRTPRDYCTSVLFLPASDTESHGSD